MLTFWCVLRWWDVCYRVYVPRSGMEDGRLHERGGRCGPRPRYGGGVARRRKYEAVGGRDDGPDLG